MRGVNNIGSIQPSAQTRFNDRKVYPLAIKIPERNNGC